MQTQNARPDSSRAHANKCSRALGELQARVVVVGLAFLRELSEGSQACRGPRMEEPPLEFRTESLLGRKGLYVGRSDPSVPTLAQVPCMRVCRSSVLAASNPHRPR